MPVDESIVRQVRIIKERARRGYRERVHDDPAGDRLLIDARSVPDPQALVEELVGEWTAWLRDHDELDRPYLELTDLQEGEKARALADIVLTRLAQLSPTQQLIFYLLYVMQHEEFAEAGVAVIEAIQDFLVGEVEAEDDAHHLSDQS